MRRLLVALDATAVMIVYLMTLMLGGSLTARAITMTTADCQALGKKIAGNAPAQTVEITCQPLPMYFASVDPMRLPQQPSFFPAKPSPE